MKVGVIIPDRGDRPEFTKHCLWMLSKQTRKPDYIKHVNFKPSSNEFDLTKRVRIGFEALKDKCDCVLIIENDDYYSSDYIERMLLAWQGYNRPQLLGVNYTYYYHIKKKQYKFLEHSQRASLMNTLISTKLDVNWCKDDYVFLDLHLWKHHKGVTFSPSPCISVGIKHGVGLCGGSGHNRMTYHDSDSDSSFLASLIDCEKCFNFYTNGE